MKKSSTVYAIPTREERKGFLEGQLRERAREWIEEMVNEELDIALGIGRYERSEERKGYRKGKRARSFTTRGGKHEIRFPRGEYFEAGPDGKKEWNSELLPRYARRTEAVEDALVMSYLCGTNTRKIRNALGPLLAGAALSKSTVSRIVARLSEHFDAWRNRDLSDEDIAIVFLDGFNLKIRIGRRVSSMPVLCAVGVRADGTKELLALEIRASESEVAWEAVTNELCERGVKTPVLAVIDGNKGLHKAVKNTWPWIEVQRCTKHKLENLYTHAPKRLYDEIKADYHAIIYAANEAEGREAWKRFEKKWSKKCPGVVGSLNEGGDELITFFKYPESMRKAIRTTNCIERMNGEFRRRVKTQGSLPNTDAGLKLLFGLFACGLISMRRLDGWRELPATVGQKRLQMGLIKSSDNVNYSGDSNGLDKAA
jgi:transposase-like protein